MTIQLESKETKVTSITYGRNGSGDDPSNVAMRVKLWMEIFDHAQLTTLLGDGNGDASAQVLWLTNDRVLTFPNLGEFEINTKVEGVSVFFDGSEVKGCDLSKFKARIKQGGLIALSFNVSILETDSEVTQSITGALKTSIPVKVTGGDLITLASVPVEEEEDN